ncbi:hypothetical protein BZG02_16670 [Labilibaculum filiforme]|uniref:DUF4249 domain-containing protein n=1 Tax=Labilibaculum filiforme TaxID=1940526 RepID=A0A2N3HT99_9BACT|nr:DUF4249 domain-containing protein [Labilibaculum filiforme]PKQ61266.1 hypothetical protein BZG02_16670 [Labilibaculum filiforme]
MKFRFLFLPICFLFLLSSCEDELEVPIPKEEPKLVINSLLGVDSVLRVHVSKSSSFQNQSSNNSLSNASIIIKENNQLLGKMKFESDGWYSLNSNLVLKNSSYQIEVSSPNLETANSETETIERIDIETISYQEIGEDKLKFTFQFNDNPIQENYYMILLKAHTGTSYIPVDFYSDNIIFNGNLSENSIGIKKNMLYGSRTFSDENLKVNGNTISIYIHHSNSNSSNTNQEYKLELYHITPDYFKYERSLIVFYNRDDLPFYNKVNLHSNINAGYGIFASYAIASETITIP